MNAREFRPPLIKPLLAMGILLFFLAGAAGCRKAEPVKKSRFLLDTLVTIENDDRRRLGDERIDRALEAGFRAAAGTENKLNFYAENSEAARLNTAAGTGEWVRLSSQTVSTLKKAKEIGRLTGGAFDITVGPVVRLWRFDGQESRPPEAWRLRRALRLVGDNRLMIDPAGRRSRLKDRGMQVDLGGIAKGAAVDRAASVLRQRGLKHTLISAVSGTTALGPKADGSPWRVGIQSPRPKTTPGLVGIIELERGHVSTTGDYQQFFIEKGRRYHHVLDPKTGYPAAGFMSVTVVTGKSAAMADALSTGLAVMGRPRAMELVRNLSDVEVVFIDSSGKIWISPGLKGRITKLRDAVK